MTAVTVNVPDDCVARIRDIAETMCKKAATPPAESRKEALIRQEKVNRQSEMMWAIPSVEECVGYVLANNIADQIDAYKFHADMERQKWTVQNQKVRWWRKLIDWCVKNKKYIGTTEVEEQQVLPASVIRGNR